MPKPLRTTVAVLTAPPIGAALAYVLVVVALELYEDIGTRGLARFFVNFMTIGSAVAYAVELAVAIPAGMLLQRRDHLTFTATLVVGAVGGVIVFLPVLRVLTGSTSAFAGTVLLGAVSGACAGAWFWVVALRERGPRHDGAPQGEVGSEPSAP
jgi:hypothetical protein